MCDKCCISCEQYPAKERKKCESWKERGRAARRAMYRAKKRK